MTTRLGLFGGSFDPVHDAHVELARTALQALRLERVLWIPAGQPWQKHRHMTPAAHREAMVRLAIEGEPRFVLERCELERTGPSYTLDTVRALQAAHPDAECVLLIGQDQYAGLHTWQGWRELLERVVLAVANRPGTLPPVHPEVQRAAHRVVPLPMRELSSSEIRQRVSRGEHIGHLVPPQVARYIEEQGLYRPEGSSRAGVEAGRGS